MSEQQTSRSNIVKQLNSLLIQSSNAEQTENTIIKPGKFTIQQQDGYKTLHWQADPSTRGKFVSRKKQGDTKNYRGIYPESVRQILKKKLNIKDDKIKQSKKNLEDKSVFVIDVDMTDIPQQQKKQPELKKQQTPEPFSLKTIKSAFWQFTAQKEKNKKQKTGYSDRFDPGNLYFRDQDGQQHLLWKPKTRYYGRSVSRGKHTPVTSIDPIDASHVLTKTLKIQKQKIIQGKDINNEPELLINFKDIPSQYQQILRAQTNKPRQFILKVGW